jgi:serine/threonine protein kinase
MKYQNRIPEPGTTISGFADNNNIKKINPGSALDLMKAGPFSEHDIAIILREILKGLDYLHSERKLHRDIKGR